MMCKEKRGLPHSRRSRIGFARFKVRTLWNAKDGESLCYLAVQYRPCPLTCTEYEATNVNAEGPRDL